jgi:hypothetical protein
VLEKSLEKIHTGVASWIDKHLIDYLPKISSWAAHIPVKSLPRRHHVKFRRDDPPGISLIAHLCCAAAGSAIKYLLCLQQRRQRSVWTLRCSSSWYTERKDTKVPLSATITQQYTRQHTQSEEPARYESGFNRLFLADSNRSLRRFPRTFSERAALCQSLSLFTPGESWWFHFVTPPRLPQKIKCLSTYSLTQSNAPPNFFHSAPAGRKSWCGISNRGITALKM